MLAITVWNVRTLMDASQAIIVHTLSKYRVDVACLPEVLFPHVSSRIIIKVSSKDIGYHSGVSHNSEENSVAIAMSEKARFVLIKWKPLNDRMALRMETASR